MDALLLNAPTDFGRMAKGNAIPLGLAYLTSYLLSQRIDTFALDLDVTPIQENELRYLIENSQPKLVGISCTTHTRFTAFEIIEKIKTWFPEIHVTIGGHHVSSAVEDTLVNSRVDSVVMGEGELTLFELTQKILNSNGTFGGVNGLAFRKDGIIHNNTPRPPIEDLDMLPFPDRDIFKTSSYNLVFPTAIMPQTKKVEYLITSRGCPFKCRFCSTAVTWQGHTRFRKAERVVDEIEYLSKERKCDGLFIYDDLFTLSNKHIDGIYREMKSRKISVPIFCYSRVDSVTYEKFEKLAKIGVRCVSFGMESGSQRILDYLNKKIAVEQIIEAVKICNDLGILAKGTFITGTRRETVKDFWHTLRLIDKLKSIQPDFVGNLGGMFGIIIYPGTQTFQDALEDKALPKDFSWLIHYPNIPAYNNAPLYQNAGLMRIIPIIRWGWLLIYTGWRFFIKLGRVFLKKLKREA